MYRLYFRDGANRRVIDYRDIQASSDEEARSACLAFRDGFHQLELWAGERLVATLPGDAQGSIPGAHG